MDGLDFVRDQLITCFVPATGSVEGNRAERRSTLRGPVQAVRRRNPPGIRGGFVLGLVPVLAVAPGCGGQPFPGSSASLDELGRHVLEAFRNNDREALEAVRLTEAEHNTQVWPELPAAQGESPFPIDLAWRNIQLRNQRAIPRLSAVLDAAQPLEFESVECLGETQAFATLSVHTDCYTRFRTRGRLYRVQLFKDVLERNGGLKIFRYYDEDPELVTGTHLPP